MCYRFDKYELDIQRQELRRMGVVVKIAPLVFRVLAYLVQHRDREVTKQELREKLWTKSSVSDETLARCLTSVRHALGDTGHTQQFIRTIYGNGYRFITAIEEDRARRETPCNDPWSSSLSIISTMETSAIDITIGEDFESYTNTDQEKCLRTMSIFLKTHDPLSTPQQRRSSVKITLGVPINKAEEFMNWLQVLPAGLRLQRLEIMASERELSQLPTR